MKRETKIFILISVISIALLTAIDIQTKGKITSLIGSVNPMDLKSSDVPYTNNGQSTVQGAIDNLYTKSKLTKRNRFLEAYTYNQNKESSNYCVTGSESTCQETTCYKTKSAGACPAGTIIKYKVNDQEVQTFHVMYDDASTITMQTQRNTIYSITWCSLTDYIGAGGLSTSTSAKNDKGPLTILKALESVTLGWINVNNQTYTMGTTTFKTNAYTGCSAYNSCTENKYTLESRTARARMITVQEANLLGCTETSQSCPVWMYNYLTASKGYGGTQEDSNHSSGSLQNTSYWTMSAQSTNDERVWMISQIGRISYAKTTISEMFSSSSSARAVVVVNKS